MVNPAISAEAAVTVVPGLPVSNAVDDLPIAYLDMNTEGVITYANRAARHLYPIPEGELVGKYVWDLLPVDEKELSRDSLLAMIRSGEDPPVIRRSIYTRTGEYRANDVHRNLVRDGQGRTVGIRCAFVDVTETQIALDEAQRACAWMESIIASMAEALIVTDALGLIRIVNPAAEALLGWKPGELKGEVIEKALPLLAYRSAGPSRLDFSSALRGHHKGIATILDRKRRQLTVKISTSPIVDTKSGFTAGVVSIMCRVEEHSQYPGSEVD